MMFIHNPDLKPIHRCQLCGLLLKEEKDPNHKCLDNKGWSKPYKTK